MKIYPIKTCSLLLIPLFTGLGIVQGQIMTNSGFEVDPVPSSPGYGPITGWSSTNTSRTGLNDASGPFHTSTSIPEGSQVGFIQSTNTDGNESLSQTVTGLTVGQRYELGLYAKNRNTNSNGLILDVDFGAGTVLTTGLTHTEYRYLRTSFVATSTSQTLTVLNNRNGGSDRTLTLDAISINQVDNAYVQNGSFEYAVNTSQVFNPSNSDWTFTPNSGGQGSGISHSGYNSSAVDGVQVGFLAGISSIEQTLTGLTIGQHYQLSWWDAARQTDLSRGDNIYNVDLTPDGGTEFSYLSGLDPVDGNWSLQEGGVFTATATEYTLRYSGTVSGDETVILDDISIAVIPEPSITSLMLMGMALVAGAAGRRRCRR